MAIKNLYSIHDVKAKECLNTVMLKNHHESDRFFKAVMENPQSPCAKYPRDYKCLCLGFIDTETGVVTGVSAPEDVTPYTWLDTFCKEKGIV